MDNSKNLEEMTAKEIGDILKTTRIEKKIALESIQEETNIRVSYLKAVEDGDYSNLPGNVYAKAYVKTYAGILGIDPTNLTENSLEEEEKADVVTLSELQRPVAASNGQNPAMWLVTIAAIAAIGFYLYTEYGDKMKLADSIESSSDKIIDYYQSTVHELSILALQPVKIEIKAGAGDAVSSKIYELDFGEIMQIYPDNQRLITELPEALEFYVDGNKTTNIQNLKKEDGSYRLNLAELLAITEVPENKIQQRP